MDFYHELLDSYSKLKKRKLKVSLQEQSQDVSYNDLVGRSDPAAQQAVQQTKQILSDILGVEVPDGQVTASDVANLPAANPNANVPNGMELQQIPSGDWKWVGSSYGYGMLKPIKGEGEENTQQGWSGRASVIEEYRTALVRLLFQTATQGALGAEGLAMDNPALTEFAQTEAGAKLVEEFPDDVLDLLALQETLKEIGLDDLADPNKKRSIFSIAANTLDENNPVGVDLNSSFLEGVEVSKQDLLESLQSVSEYFKTHKKLTSGQADDVTQDTLAKIKETVVFVTDEKGREKAFFRSANDSSIGLSFDSDTKLITQTLRDHQKFIEAREQDNNEDLSHLYIDEFERGSILDRTDKAIRSNKAITEISETIDTVILSFVQGNKKEAKKLYEGLAKKFGGNMSKAVGVVEGVNDGKFVGTEETLELQEFVDILEQEYKGSAINLMNALGKRRIQALKKAGPDAVWRVGQGGGAKGNKKDQILIYTSAEKAKKNNHSSSVKTGKVRDLIPEKEHAQFKKMYKVDLDSEISYVGESLKAKISKSHADFKLGQQPNLQKVSTEFSTGKSAFTKELYSFLGVKGEERALVSQNFGSIESAMSQIDGLMNSKTPTGSKKSIQTLVTNTLGDMLEQYGLDPKQLIKNIDAGESDHVKERVKRAISFQILKNGVESEDKATARSWRQAEACLIARSGYDADNSYDSVEDIPNNKTHRFQRNKMLMSVLRPYMDGEGSIKRNQSKASFNIGGISYGLSKLNSASCSVGPGVWKKSIKESTEQTLITQLLETQQQLFSLLIKE